jgi:hypothetical protein
VNLDGRDDLVWHRSDNGEIGAWTLNAGGTHGWASLASLAYGNVWKMKAVGDINGDQRADLIWQKSTDGSLCAWTINSTTTTHGSLSLGAISPTSGWRLIGVADFDQSGFEDLLWYKLSDGSLGAWLMAAGGSHTWLALGSMA